MNVLATPKNIVNYSGPIEIKKKKTFQYSRILCLFSFIFPPSFEASSLGITSFKWRSKEKFHVSKLM